MRPATVHAGSQSATGPGGGAVAHQIETIAQGYKAMAAACIPAWWKTWSSGQKSNQIDTGPFWQGVIPVLTAVQSAQTLGGDRGHAPP